MIFPFKQKEFKEEIRESVNKCQYDSHELLMIIITNIIVIKLKVFHWLFGWDLVFLIAVFLPTRLMLTHHTMLYDYA